MTLQDHVAITGLSIASALGRTMDELTSSILLEKRGLRFEHRFQDTLPVPLGELDLEQWDVPHSMRQNSDQVMRRVLLAMLEQLAFDTQVFRRYEAHEIGFFLGTTTSGVDGFFTALAAHKQSHQPLWNFLSPGMQQVWVAQEMKKLFPLTGPFLTFSSSCAAAAQAIGQAYDAVRSGMCKVAIAGGIDILNPVTLHGFNALQILDSDFCAPFTRERKGINLGEGGAVLLLEKAPQSAAKAYIHGYAALSEAYHMVQPAQGGPWMTATMQRALHKAHWSAASIDYINAHGTGTESNDAAEAAAIESVFGDLRRTHATKRLTGHYLGASGAIEAAVTVAMLQQHKAWCLPRALVPTSNQSARGISNSFGFGGSNISLLFSADVL